MPPKKHNKTKQELVNDLQKQKKVKSQRAFVKDKFYPALKQATTSIDDAKFLLSSFSSLIMEKFLADMKEKKFIDLKLHEKLDKSNPLYKEFINLLALFGNETVFDARELIEGMRGEIELMVSEEMKTRKLDTLKDKFLD